MDHCKTNVSNRRNENVRGPRGPDFAPILWTPKYLDSPLTSKACSVKDADGLSTAPTETNSGEAAVPVSIDQERITATPEKPPDRCVSHMDPTRWVRSHVPDRLGWEEARCRDCGTFIGFNPIPESTGRLSENRPIEPDRLPRSGLRGSDSLNT